MLKEGVKGTQEIMVTEENTAKKLWEAVPWMYLQPLQ